MWGDDVDDEQQAQRHEGHKTRRGNVGLMSEVRTLVDGILKEPS